MGDKITIVELAKLANVSTATVSRIINNTGRVNEDKRRLVLELIDRYNYKPNQIAKALQSSKSNTVGFVVPHINSPYYAQVFFETELIAQKNGYTLMLCNSEGNARLESKILNEFISANVRAIIFMGGRIDNLNGNGKQMRELEKVSQSIPVISCVNVPDLDCIQIYEQEEAGTIELLAHLAQMGYTDVALLGGCAHIRTTRKRRTEVRKHAPAYGIRIRDEIVESDYSVEGGNIAMQKLLEQDRLPQAIICINDLVATGVLSEAYKHNLNVPGDIAITGYDNIDISQFIYPGITTIASDYKKIAEELVGAVQNVEELERYTRIEVATRLIVRGTTQLK